MRAILAVNAGSSSLKLSLFDVDGDSDAVGDTQGARNGSDDERAPRGIRAAKDGLTRIAHEVFDGLDANEALRRSALDGIADWCARHAQGRELIAAGHRVVHGGSQFVAPAIVDDAVLVGLEALVPLAPLHQPLCLAPIHSLLRSSAALTQVACFDTAFHHGRPSSLQRYAIPERFFQDGIRRYGFHGLSYEYIASALGDVSPGLAAGRVIVAHLGNGASLCAIFAGECIDTTMGFSTLSGVPMGTRCGELDAGVVLHLLRDGTRSVADVEHLLYRESGLLGMSGVSGDMRALLASASPAAQGAVDCFVVRIAREIGALTAMLGGLNALVFTAGIGEHSAEIRERICRASTWTGLELDEGANTQGRPRVSTAASKVEAWVIATDEERMIARHALAALPERQA